jgi:ATP-dependent DNA helicase PIF1
LLDEATIEVLAKKAILTPKNEHVHKLNEEILKRCEGEAVKYFSNDSVTDDGEGSAEDYPVEYVNTLTPSVFPLRQLKLKVGAIIMLLRNLNKKRGLCNGTRLVIKSLKPHFHSRRNIARKT